MRLMRNLTEDGTCKYAAVRNDKIANLSDDDQGAAREAMRILANLGVLENPRRGDPEEFLLIKLKDVNSTGGFIGYADAARAVDPELAADVLRLACRAMQHPNQKHPD